MNLNDVKTTLVSGGITDTIYLMRMKQGDSYPAIVLNIISQNADHNLTETQIIKTRIQISVFSPFYATARTISESIRVLLDHSSPSWGSVLHDSTDDAHAMPTATDKPVYHVASNFMVIHEP